MAQQRDAELHRADLHPACRKALESLGRHWAGLTVFVDHPEVPMDNNAAERTNRPGAGPQELLWFRGDLERPTGGVHVFDFADLAVVEPVVSGWLTAYLQACAEAGGVVPANPEAFLP